MPSYFVCATPRSGSSLLLGLLASTGVAGHPQAYFRTPDEPLWATRWNLTEPVDYRAYLQAARAHGSTPNGVFGAKLMWDALQDLQTKLEPATLTDVFDAPRFIHLHRDDVIAQAVSWLRAEQTDTWYLGGHGEISGNTPAPTRPAPAYDDERITELIQTITEQNRAWDAWFTTTGARPYRLSYTDLTTDPPGTVRKLLTFLGLSLPAGREPVAHHRRQSDALNTRWITRYRAHPR